MLRICPVVALLICFLLAGCSSDRDQRDRSTIEMAERLSELHEHLSPENPFANSLRLQHLSSLPLPNNPGQRIQHLATLGQEQLYAGLTDDALISFHEAESIMEENPTLVPEEFYWMLKDVIALSYLRLGEQENCIEHPTSASCIVPIRTEGVHQFTRGSEKAIEYYESILNSQSGNLNHQLLLNFAYMTLDRYPHEVPDQWRIPQEIFQPETEFPHFNEIAANLGLDVVALSGGSIVEDFTGNGYLDIVTSSWHLKDQVLFFVNNGDGTFTDHTEKANITGITGGLNMVHGDFTNNGFSDIYILRGAWMERDGMHPNSLLRNNGDGTFTDVTVSAGVIGDRPTQTASWADFNNNGLLDLIVGYESSEIEHPAQLFMNNGDGTFTDVAAETGIDFTGFVKGVIWGDINNNGLQDLYVSRLGQPNLLFENQGADENGNWSFREIADRAGVSEPISSFPAWFWDYNNNGYLDLFVSAYQIDYGDVVREFMGEEIQGEHPRLYKNNGDGTFTDVTEQKDLKKVLYTMGSNFGDLDNDGFLDFYAGTGDPDYRSLMPNRMFKNVDGSSFQEVTYAGGFGSIQKGHGVSFADLNNNGFQDIYINMGGALEGDIYQNLLFENPGNSHNWVTLILEGEVSNQAALNTRIEIVITENGSQRSIHRHITSGGSFGGSPFRQETGLGQAESIDKIIVTWPASGIVQTFENVSVNQFYKINEQSDTLTELPLNSFPFSSGEDHTDRSHSH
ncbi:MAG: CRTAC1 family protein [Balneolaceae bacterium]|nr:CRTAC1 family protein [Balneolaceae bacterium]MCH8549639.1 CRTAC1 family protein [Balneolaceae bacterium]